jgi:hypothetical protein
MSKQLFDLPYYNNTNYPLAVKGQLEQVFKSGVQPNDEKITSWIEN